MTPAAWILLLFSWVIILGLALYCLVKTLRRKS
jgi:ABC-type nickel/cobalt efflux system permease component RcnA